MVNCKLRTLQQLYVWFFSLICCHSQLLDLVSTLSCLITQWSGKSCHKLIHYNKWLSVNEEFFPRAMGVRCFNTKNGGHRCTEISETHLDKHSMQPCAWSFSINNLLNGYPNGSKLPSGLAENKGFDKGVYSRGLTVPYIKKKIPPLPDNYSEHFRNTTYALQLVQHHLIVEMSCASEVAQAPQVGREREQEQEQEQERVRDPGAQTLHSFLTLPVGEAGWMNLQCLHRYLLAPVWGEGPVLDALALEELEGCHLAAPLAAICLGGVELEVPRVEVLLMKTIDIITKRFERDINK